MQDIDEYQEFTKTTVKYPMKVESQYVLLGLTEELGEFVGAFKKFHRGDYDEEELVKRAIGEAGDVLWYMARTLDVLGLKMSDVLQHNVDKLNDRLDRGVIKGDGDDR